MIDPYILREPLCRENLKERKFIQRDIVENLKAKYNSIKTIYEKLNEEELLSREGFSSYNPYYSSLIKHLIYRIAALGKAKN
jgi:hypothetical protein